MRTANSLIRLVDGPADVVIAGCTAHFCHDNFLLSFFSDRRSAFYKQLNYKWEQLNPNLLKVHIPTLPYEAFDCYGMLTRYLPIYG